MVQQQPKISVAETTTNKTSTIIAKNDQSKRQNLRFNWLKKQSNDINKTYLNNLKSQSLELSQQLSPPPLILTPPILSDFEQKKRKLLFSTIIVEQQKTNQFLQPTNFQQQNCFDPKYFIQQTNNKMRARSYSATKQQPLLLTYNNGDTISQQNLNLLPNYGNLLNNKDKKILEILKNDL